MAKILVVDDDPSTVTLLRTRLTAAGHEVVSVANAGDGVNGVFRHHPDAVVMDVRLVTMDGVEAVGLIRRLGYDGVIAMLTALHEPDLPQRAEQAGCNAFFRKPIDAEFAHRIEDLIAAHVHYPPRARGETRCTVSASA